MIKNIIFDLMHVLIHISYDEKAKKINIDLDEYTFFTEHILTHNMWQEMERGLYSLQEGKEIFSDIFPDHQETIYALLDDDWTDVLTINPKMFDIIEAFKDDHKHIFLMGDIIAEQALFLAKNEAFTSLFEGSMFSFEVKKTTNNIQLYEQFLENFHLEKEETLFIIQPKKDPTLQELAAAKHITITSLEDGLTF